MRSAWPPGPIYHLLTTSPAWPGLNSPPKVPWWAELSISVPENGPFFKSEIEKNFRRFFFSEIFSANKLFLWLQKIVLDLIYQIRQEYCDLRRSVPPIFELEGGTPKMTKNDPKRPKMAFLARLTGSGNKK